MRHQARRRIASVMIGAGILVVPTVAMAQDDVEPAADPPTATVEEDVLQDQWTSVDLTQDAEANSGWNVQENVTDQYNDAFQWGENYADGGDSDATADVYADGGAEADDAAAEATADAISTGGDGG